MTGRNHEWGTDVLDAGEEFRAPVRGGRRLPLLVQPPSGDGGRRDRRRAGCRWRRCGRAADIAPRLGDRAGRAGIGRQLAASRTVAAGGLGLLAGLAVGAAVVEPSAPSGLILATALERVGASARLPVEYPVCILPMRSRCFVGPSVPSSSRDLVTEIPGPKARAHVAFDETWTSPSLPRAYPIVPVRGEGLTIEDIDGNLFLDFAAGIAVNSTGHSHPQVVAAIKEQAAELIHFSASDFYLPIYPEVCRRLAEITPVAGGKARVYLGNSGTEVVETAIKLARHATKRPYIVAFLGAFHGRSYGSVSLTASKAKYHAGFGPLLPGVFHAPFGRVEDLRWFDDVLFDKLAPANEVAAIIVEPIQGEGGYVVPEDGFLAGLREICDRHGIVLVFDEIQSGAGRTGTMWAAEQWDVKPDVVLSAKGIASGMPLGALIAPGGPARVAGARARTARRTAAIRSRVPRPSRRSTCSRAASSRTPGSAGSRRSPGSASSRRRFPGLVTDVRGRGLMIGIEFDTAEHAEEVQWAAFQRGLLVLECGKTSVRMSPALTVSEAEMATALRIFGEAVGDVAGEHHKLHDAAEAAHAMGGVEAAG